MSLPKAFIASSEDDHLQPNPQQFEAALRQSRRYWQTVASQAISQLREGLPSASINPRCMLSKPPAIRGSLREPFSCRLGASTGDALCVQASSDWAVPDDCDCGLKDQSRTISSFLQIGSGDATPCHLEVDRYLRIGTSTDQKSEPNYIGILALGWAYIISARLVEIRGGGAKMLYTEAGVATTQAQYREMSTVIDIGNVDAGVLRWWQAILSPSGEGWLTIIAHHNERPYYSPWSVRREDQNTLGIRWRDSGATVPNDLQAPLSSKRAFEALVDYAILHNLGSQLLAALDVTLTFPTHNYHGTTIQLSFTPGLQVAQESETHPKKSEWQQAYADLPHYMTLSCSPEIVMSSLCGMFWEDNVNCNMVTPWLHPVLNELPRAKMIADTPGLYFDVLTVLCSIRRPQISALWLGASLSGLVPIILQRVRGGQPPLDANAFPWTGSPQSFMDIPGTGPDITDPGEKVQRADVWRLLYLPPTIEDDLHYSSRPFTPWSPPGHTIVRNCALRVSLHLNCQRHHLEYRCWNWELNDGTISKDGGLGPLTPSLAQRDPIASGEFVLELPEIHVDDQAASREASRDIFWWVTVNGEGNPPEEVYKDDWVQLESEGEESSIADESDGTFSV